LDLEQNLSCIFRFPTFYVLKFVPQDLFQPATQDGMIIGNENSNHWPASGRLLSVFGIRTFTVVPLPGTPRMVKSPWSSQARSRIPMMPSDLPAKSSFSSIPWPLS
jgi:hypothetical protein